jgi:uncharacterized delta-60 repeat protein
MTRRRLTLATAFLTVGALLTFPAEGLARPGDLDPTFSGNGIVRGPQVRGSQLGSTMYSANAVATQSDGRIVVADQHWIARYRPNGNLDTSFGHNGYVDTFATAGIGAAFEGLGLGVLPGGQIMIAGSVRVHGGSPAFQARMAVSQFKPDGDLNTSFGDGGAKVVPGLGFSYGGQPTALAIGRDGSIVLAGETWNPLRNEDFAVAKLTPKGQLDPSFSGDGMKAFGFARRQEEFPDVSIDRRGRIVVAAKSAERGRRRHTAFGIGRLKPSGRADRSFAGDGLKLVHGTGVAEGLAIRRRSQILVAGERPNHRGTRSKIVLAQVKASGSIDRSFGDRGLAHTAARKRAYAGDVALQGDGKALLVGSTDSRRFHSDALLLRYTRGARLDRTFSGNGRTITDFGGNDVGGGIAVQSNGKILTCASTAFYGRHATPIRRWYDLARYKNNGLPAGG